MDIDKFYDMVDAAKDLTGVGVDETDHGKGVIVKHEPTNMSVRIPVDAVKGADWDTLYSVIVGEREPTVLQHMTRIVGYYSKIASWNKSKIGELKDRHKGNYAVESK